MKIISSYFLVLLLITSSCARGASSLEYLNRKIGELQRKFALLLMSRDGCFVSKASCEIRLKELLAKPEPRSNQDKQEIQHLRKIIERLS